nr:hypothetical protein [uncultured bacterium]
MVFSDSVNKLGIIEDIDFWVGSDSNSYPTAQKTRNINAWLDREVSLILQSDAKWEWDDLNNSDLPVGTLTLTSGTQSYAINTTYLKLRAIACKDSNGVYHYLDRIDESSPQAGSIELMESTKTSGVPVAYAHFGNLIVLDKKPSYTVSAGLKFYFQRNVTYFTAADTTATPGFAPMFHRVLSLGAALDYTIKHDLSEKIITRLQNRIDKLEAALMEYYASRDQDAKVSISLSQEDYGINELNDFI